MGMMIGVCMCIFTDRRVIRSKVATIILLAVCMVAFIAFGASIVMDRSDVNSYFGQDGEASSGDRLLAWKAAIGMFFDNPLFGVGWGKFTENVRNYGLDKKLIAHNTMLSVLAETGIIGFYFFSAILIITFRQLIEIRQKISPSDNLNLMAQGVLLSLICFVFNTSFSVKDHEPIYWTILYLSGAIYSCYRSNSKMMSSE